MVKFILFWGFLALSVVAIVAATIKSGSGTSRSSSATWRAAEAFDDESIDMEKIQADREQGIADTATGLAEAAMAGQSAASPGGPGGIGVSGGMTLGSSQAQRYENRAQDYDKNASDEPAPVREAGTQPAPTQPPAPAVFSGKIVSDNQWFVITVTDAKTASGNLNVSLTPDGGGRVKQTGSFAGTINDKNIIICAGTYRGVSIDQKGREFPHSGKVTIRAVPTSKDQKVWEITAVGDPGDTVVLPGHAE